jgi:hypothetical protein
MHTCSLRISYTYTNIIQFISASMHENNENEEYSILLQLDVEESEYQI